MLIVASSYLDCKCFARLSTAMGMEEGITLAMGQIDALLT
jgi:hypothetical protein